MYSLSSYLSIYVSIYLCRHIYPRAIFKIDFHPYCLSVRSLDGRFPSHTPDLHACLFVLKCPWPFRLCASSNGGLVVPLAAVTQTCVWFLFAGFVHPQGENSPTRSPRPQVGHLGELRTWQGKNRPPTLHFKFF